MAVNSNIGKQVGNYRLVKVIGVGGFGEVYRAEHLYLNRSVAVKVLNAQKISSQEECDKFLYEARLLEMLKHPHILPIIDVGIQDGSPYLMTEYAPKGSLDARIKSQHPFRISIQEALIILSQLGEGLQHAHEQQPMHVVHRDLKPANILFNEKGDALLADFGISIESLGTQSVSDVSGSYPYMAPEVFRGVVSRRTDQYALACIAYELLTGHRAIDVPLGKESDHFSWLNKQTNEMPVSPRQYNQDISERTSQAILKALAKNYHDRHMDVRTFLVELTAESQNMVPLPDLPTIFVPLPANLLANNPLVAQVQIQVQSTKTAEQWLTEGHLHYKTKRYPEALEAYRQAHLLGSHDINLYKNQGNILRELKRHEDALESYTEALRLDPKQGTFHNIMGDILRELRRYQEALEAYENAIRCDPAMAIFHYNKGEVLLREYNSYQEALEAYEQVIQHATFPVLKIKAYSGKGEAHRGLNEYEEALQAYLQAIALDANNAKLYTSKGDILRRLGRYEAARTAYDQAIGFEPQNAELYFKKGNILKLQGKMKEAQFAHERARQLGYGK